MKKIKWGLLGYGKAAKNFYSSFKNDLTSEIYGVASKTRFKDLTQKKNIKIFSNYPDLINATEVDIVYISLINSLHYENLKLCINAKKNILVEKPSCTNYFELKKISNIIIDNKIYFKECILYLGHPLIKNIQKIIHNNEIGKVIEINSQYGFKFNKKKFFFFIKKKNKNLFNKKLGGGAINNFATYPLSSAIILSGSENYPEILNLSALAKYESGVDAKSKCKVLFSNNIKSEFTVSLIDNLKSEIEIKGEKGTIYVENPWLPKKNYEINLIKNNIKKSYKFEEKENLWTAEKRIIINDLLAGRKMPSIRGTELHASLKYLKFIDIWKYNISLGK